MGKFLTFFKSKGIMATLIGLAIAIPVNVIAIRIFASGNGKDVAEAGAFLSEGQLIALVIFNVLAMAWVILPSRIVIKSKIFEFIIED